VCLLCGVNQLATILHDDLAHQLNVLLSLVILEEGVSVNGEGRRLEEVLLYLVLSPAATLQLFITQDTVIFSNFWFKQFFTDLFLLQQTLL
jgi:hypothetical protein